MKSRDKPVKIISILCTSDVGSLRCGSTHEFSLLKYTGILECVLINIVEINIICFWVTGSCPLVDLTPNKYVTL